MILKTGKYYLVNLTEESKGDSFYTIPINKIKIGKLIYISEISDDDTNSKLYQKYRYLFEFIDDINGHNGNSDLSSGESGHCWWVSKRDIKRLATEDEVMVELL